MCHIKFYIILHKIISIADLWRFVLYNAIMFRYWCDIIDDCRTYWYYIPFLYLILKLFMFFYDSRRYASSGASNIWDIFIYYGYSIIGPVNFGYHFPHDLYDPGLIGIIELYIDMNNLIELCTCKSTTIFSQTRIIVIKTFCPVFEVLNGSLYDTLF